MPVGESGQILMPTGWTGMSDTDLPVVDYSIAVANGSDSGTFVFRVRRQPSSTRTFATLSTSYERYVLTFLVSDITNYDAATNPMTTFGTTMFTTMLIKALRSLIVGGTSMIPKPGDLVNYGVATYVDTVDIAQTSDKEVDTFLITCNIKEAQSSSAQPDDDAPKLNKSEEIPPWQMPAELTFDSQTTEGMSLGFAYPVQDLYGDKQYSDADLRLLGISAGDKTVPVQNYAGDPFSSPPAFPKVNGTLKVTKSFLRGGGPVDLTGLHGTVNATPISMNVQGAILVFPAGTLSPASMSITPKLYKMPIPWLPKTKHPLNKTYGELFYGYSKTTANRVAVNRTGQIVLVNKPLRYIEVAASFTFRPEGFAVWLANRGYTELDSSAADGRKTITDDKGTVKEAWLTKTGKRALSEHLWRGFTMTKASASVVTLLNQFFASVGTEGFAWASTKDNFGQAVL